MRDSSWDNMETKRSPNRHIQAKDGKSPTLFIGESSHKQAQHNDNVSLPSVSAPPFVPQSGPSALVEPGKLRKSLIAPESVPTHFMGKVEVALCSEKTTAIWASYSRVITFDEDYWLLVLHKNHTENLSSSSQTMTPTPGRVELRAPSFLITSNTRDKHHACFFIPRTILPGLEASMDAMCKLDADAQRFHPIIVEYLGSLLKTVSFMSGSEGELAEKTMVVMIRTSLAWFSGQFVDGQLAVMANQFELAKRYIDRNLLSSELNIESIQSHLGVSRRQLYNIFASRGGVSRYIRTRRLRACYKELLDENATQPVYRIAEKYSFHDSANFSRLFRAEFGLRASDVRGHTEGVPPKSTGLKS